LDEGKYGTFKTNMLNSWAAGAFEPPATINQLYRTAGSWVKQAPKVGSGSATTYVTLEEGNRRKRQKKNPKVRKKRMQSKRPLQKTNPITSAGAVEKKGIWRT
jgi:hypothetical protein